MVADLHMHSLYSDGSFRPRQLVERAAENEITTIALADHDTVEGLDEAIAAGEEYGIDVIPALEFSTFQAEAEIHILGYFINHYQQDLLKTIDKIFQARIKRAHEMVFKLNKIGVNITVEEVEKIAGDKYLGRPHIAKTMVEAGYINDMADAFTDKFIGNKGAAYVPKFKLSPEDAIETIQKAEGIAVIAHPYFINHGKAMDLEQIVGLKDKGLTGIEAYHAKHSPDVAQYYLQIADKLDLVVTAGSDFHGENSPGIDIGDVVLNEAQLHKFYSVAGRRANHN